MHRRRSFPLGKCAVGFIEGSSACVKIRPLDLGSSTVEVLEKPSRWPRQNCRHHEWMTWSLFESNMLSNHRLDLDLVPNVECRSKRLIERLELSAGQERYSPYATTHIRMHAAHLRGLCSKAGQLVARLKECQAFHRPFLDVINARTTMSRHHKYSTSLGSADIPLIQVDSVDSRPESYLRSSATLRSSTNSLPKQGQTFRRSRSNATFEILTDFLFGLSSAVFFVYGLYVVHYNGKPVAEHRDATNALINATKIVRAWHSYMILLINLQGPTIFPILFAAVLGRALKAIMLWRIERGERLGLLDLLAGSTTVVNTILTQISLRIVSMAGVILIAAWAVSPLGGQASLRVMTVGEMNSTSTTPVRYMSANHSYYPYIGADLGPVGTLMNGLFTAALLGPERVKESPNDLWNNIKVPFLEDLAADPALLANKSWITVPDHDVTYVSLIGLPVADVPSTANATFTMETFYWTLDCSALTEAPQPDSSTNHNASNGWVSQPGEQANTQILTHPPPGKNTSTGLCRGDPYDPNYTPLVFAYNSWDATETHLGALCGIWTSYVEIQVHCTGASNCSAVAMRNSTVPHPNQAWTTLESPSGSCNAQSWFFVQFDNAVMANRGGTMTPVQGYLLDPNSPALPSLDKPMTSVPKDVFAVRLAQLLNTFWSTSAGPYAVPYGFAGDPPKMTDSGRFDNGLAANVSNTIAQVTTTFDVIRCHQAWLGVLLGSSIFMIAACLLSIALRLKSKTPELSLNWSTLTRDNPYVESDFSASTMDHARRSRMMKRQMVRFGDVEPEREFGHFAVGSMEFQAVKRADKRRTFD